MSLISPDDDSYKATKLIKQGKATIQPPLEELADFIQKEYGVEVLNVIFEKATDLRPCRLEVVTETVRDEQVFRSLSEHGWYGPDKEKGEAIVVQFLRLTQATIAQYPKLYVVYSAFKRVAIDELYGGVTVQQRQELLKTINNPELWHVDSLFSGVTFFFYDEDQKKRYESSDELTRAVRVFIGSIHTP